MRVVKELTQGDIRISIFSWNNKYILKYELGPLEQTYKVSEMDILEEKELEGFLSEPFLEGVKNNFEVMGEKLRFQLENG
ncbi:hypothetical protein A3SI_11174 [Nitritalea halalkaliphila LW7]|uniref:Uncharacterized protein n=1 Tax=Nitritalea halalkaliphila LW7 TaxID=1189621 RepID=I5C2Y0_9BACT|nr:hypothetical protein [Nitritalea halalkaliphila]EIM76182.1 hypothetical protein A3SI_11174 [Nitritalea halalkaliphila LW7]